MSKRDELIAEKDFLEWKIAEDRKGQIEGKSMSNFMYLTSLERQSDKAKIKKINKLLAWMK